MLAPMADETFATFNMHVVMSDHGRNSANVMPSFALPLVSAVSRQLAVRKLDTVMLDIRTERAKPPPCRRAPIRLAFPLQQFHILEMDVKWEIGRGTRAGIKRASTLPPRVQYGVKHSRDLVRALQ
jgi:hypothetical protein